MNWLDWLIIVLLGLSAFGGLRHGFVTSVAKLTGILAGLWVAFTYYRPLAEFLTAKWDMQDRMLPMVEKFLQFWQPDKNTVPTVNTSTVDLLTKGPVNQMGDYLVGVFTAGVLEAISFLVLLLATAWVVGLAGHILTKLTKLCFLGPLNHLGGLFFGFVKGVIMVMIILTLLAPLLQPVQLPETRSGKPQVREPAGKAFRESKLLPYFEPLFHAVNRPFPGSPTDNDPLGPVRSI